MNKSILAPLLAIFMIGLAFGWIGGNIFYQVNGGSHDHSSHDHSTDSDKSTAMAVHAHSKFEVDPEYAPTVKLNVVKDNKSGWNFIIETTKFKFTPENVNKKNVVGEGHAHLYIGDKKIARVYGDYYHYDQNFDSEQEFRVTLNANDHSEYYVNGKPIESSVIVQP